MGELRADINCLLSLFTVVSHKVSAVYSTSSDFFLFSFKLLYIVIDLLIHLLERFSVSWTPEAVCHVQVTHTLSSLSPSVIQCSRCHSSHS